MICPNCHAETGNDVRFCENCGTPLQDIANAAAAQQTQQMPSQGFTGNAGDTTQLIPPQGFTGDNGGATQQIPPQGYAGGSGVQQTQQMPYSAGSAAGSGFGANPNAGQPYNQPYGQTYGQPPAQPGQPTAYGASQQQVSIAPFVLAIIALVVSLLGLFPISIILAIIALVMNSGQKKRGEVSTKQTPTFVMSLISLIISALMLIFTIMVGGLVWAALESGEIDELVDEIESADISVSASDGSTSITFNNKPTDAESADARPDANSAEADSTAATGAGSTGFGTVDPVGVWTLDSLYSDGEETSSDDLDMIRGLGLEVTFTVNEDGSAVLMLFGEEMKGTWESEGDGLAFTVDGDTVHASIDGDIMTMKEGSDELTFRKK